MDNLVSVPVTHPSTFLKQQDKAWTGLNPTDGLKDRQVARWTQRDPDDDPVIQALVKTIKSPDAGPPVKARRPAKKDTPVKRKLTQEWLEF